MFFYRHKIEKLIELQKEKNRANREKESYYDEEMKLGFKDVLAVIISAMIVFGPIILVLIAIALWAVLTM